MLLVGGFTALIVIIVFLLYLVFDAGVSLAYSRASNESTAAAYKKLSSVVLSEWKTLSEEKVVEKLTAIETKQGSNNLALIKREKNEGLVWYDGVRFEFRDGKLVEVK